MIYFTQTLLFWPILVYNQEETMVVEPRLVNKLGKHRNKKQRQK